MQLIRRLDTGERQSEIGAALNLAASTIKTILKNKKTATMTSSATGITRSLSEGTPESRRVQAGLSFSRILKRWALKQPFPVKRRHGYWRRKTCYNRFQQVRFSQVFPLDSFDRRFDTNRPPSWITFQRQQALLGVISLPHQGALGTMPVISN
ncbi:hypothetical protein TNCV_3841551 [Trichonephila clavipes]|nr:hypothetical protein TNCV_3841551 [Trichonephila clavipes]